MFCRFAGHVLTGFDGAIFFDRSVKLDLLLFLRSLRRHDAEELGIESLCESRIAERLKSLSGFWRDVEDALAFLCRHRRRASTKRF